MNNKEHLSEKAFPWSQVIGYVGSIVLTVMALWFTVKAPVSQGSLITILLGFAVLQILIQLVFFMHITEKKGSAYHSYEI
jgi:cytochrome aa3 quinol oxidase subunit IV